MVTGERMNPQQVAGVAVIEFSSPSEAKAARESIRNTNGLLI